MGNTSSAATSQNASKCNSCSQSGLYFSFGKKTDANFYALIKGKQRRVYVDSKGKYYNENYKKSIYQRVLELTNHLKKLKIHPKENQYRNVRVTMVQNQKVTI